MKRCLSERELFAAMDARLAAGRKEHLAACPTCAGRLARMTALRAAALEASTPSTPDWDRVEAGVLRAIRAAQKPRPAAGWSLVPVGLSFAAALLVALAIAVGWRPGPEGTGSARKFETVAPMAELPVRAPLEAAVSERFGPGALDRGARVQEDGRVDCGPGGGVRLALGDDIVIEELGPAGLTVASLDEWRPTVQLDTGAFQITVAEGALPHELVVLAAHAEFAVYSGTAEVVLIDGALEVRAIGSTARVGLGGVARDLEPGEGLRRSAGDEIGLASAWDRLPVAWEGAGLGDGSPLSLDRPGGSLPKQVVRKVLRSNTERMRFCYESALKRYPGLESVHVDARLRVGINGRVARLSLSGVKPWPDLERCLEEVLGGMRFPPPSGGEVELITPLRLTPRD